MSQEFIVTYQLPGDEAGGSGGQTDDLSGTVVQKKKEGQEGRDNCLVLGNRVGQ